MLDFPLMLQVKLPVADRIQPQSNKFHATRVENNATGDLKFNDSPAIDFVCFLFLGFVEFNVIIMTDSSKKQDH